MTRFQYEQDHMKIFNLKILKPGTLSSFPLL